MQETTKKLFQVFPKIKILKCLTGVFEFFKNITTYIHNSKLEHRMPKKKYFQTSKFVMLDRHF